MGLRRAFGLTLAALAAASLAAAAPASAAPPPSSKPQYRVVSRDVHIRMNDGVRLAATIGFPSKNGTTPAPGRFPPILTMTPYGKDLSAPSSYFVSRGYVHAVVDIRGAGASEGNLNDNYFSPREQRDGYELVEWLGTRSWSNGRVGMMGGSYLGITQYLTAIQRPPHLKAIVPEVALGDLYREATYHGGILSGFFGAQYLAVQGGPGLLSGLNEPSDPGSLFTAKVGQAQSDPIAFDYLARNTYDSWYRERSPIERADRIAVPTLIIDGWFDGFIRGAPEMFRAIRSTRRLWIDPYPHKGSKSFPYNPLGYDRQDSQNHGTLVWFDGYLKGTRRYRAKPVKLFVMGRDRYLLARKWPVEATRYRRFYLGAGERLSTAKPKAASASYPTNPHSGWTDTLSRHGNLAATPYLPADQSLERGEGLVFDTPRLSKPLTVAGPITTHLEASSSAARTDWFVKLSDVAPDGTATLLTEGYLRATHRALDRRRSLPWRPYHPHDREVPLEPGRTYPFEIEVWPTANEFRVGHRLRVQITSTDTPNHLAGSVRADRDDPSTFQLEPNPPAVNTVKLGSSFLTVPGIERCQPPARRVVSGKRFGPATLGATLSRTVDALGIPVRSKRGFEIFCLSGGGTFKVGYRDAAALRKERSRVYAAWTDTKALRVRGIKVGSRFSRARRKLGLRKLRFKVGSGRVYEARRNPRRRLFVGVRKRRVAYLAVVDPRRVRGKTATAKYLRRAVSR